MKNNKLLIGLITCLLALGSSVSLKAAEPTDSIPTKKPEEPIKEVPKSRKQEKPLPVTIVAIKPAAIKPKIVVKPIIKVH